MELDKLLGLGAALMTIIGGLAKLKDAKWVGWSIVALGVVVGGAFVWSAVSPDALKALAPAGRPRQAERAPVGPPPAPRHVSRPHPAGHDGGPAPVGQAHLPGARPQHEAHEAPRSPDFGRHAVHPGRH